MPTSRKTPFRSLVFSRLLKVSGTGSGSVGLSFWWFEIEEGSPGGDQSSRIDKLLPDNVFARYWLEQADSAPSGGDRESHAPSTLAM